MVSKAAHGKLFTETPFRADIFRRQLIFMRYFNGFRPGRIRAAHALVVIFLLCFETVSALVSI